MKTSLHTSQACSVDLCSKAMARATTANQPAFDSGGFPLMVQRCLFGKLGSWETLTDSVSIRACLATEGEEGTVTITSHIEETDVPALPDVPTENCASRSVIQALRILRSHGVAWRWSLHIDVTKGISIKGTGLGSSGASAAAAFKAFEGLLPILGIEYEFSDSERIGILIAGDDGVPDNSISAYFGGWVVFDAKPPYGIRRLVVHPNFCNFVFVCPRGFGIATSLAREVLPREIPEHKETVKLMHDAIIRGDIQSYAASMEAVHKWFVEPRSHLYPGNGEIFRKVYAAAKEAGALGVTISGAGPGLLALVENEQHAESVGKALYDAFGSCGYDSVSFLADICPSGATVLPPQSHAVS